MEHARRAMGSEARAGLRAPLRLAPLLFLALPWAGSAFHQALPARLLQPSQAPCRRVLPTSHVLIHHGRDRRGAGLSDCRRRHAAVPDGTASVPVEVEADGVVVPSPAADPPSFLPDDPSFLYRMTAVVSGTLFTWLAHNHYGYNRVLSSASFTLLASLVAPGLGQAAMCGTFSGFSTALLIPTLPTALLLGLVTFLVFEIVIHQRDAARGLGGRLGLMAFISVNLTLLGGRLLSTLRTASPLLSGLPATAPLLPFLLTKTPFAPPALNTAAVTLAYTALGAVSTVWLRESWNEIKDPVRGAAYVGVAGGMLLHPTVGDLATLSLYCGAFLGMSSPSRLERYAPWNPPPLAKARTMLSYALAGLLAGAVTLATNSLWVGGWGGKLGACAFAGAASFRGLLTLFENLVVRRRLRKEAEARK